MRRFRRNLNFPNRAQGPSLFFGIFLGVKKRFYTRRVPILDFFPAQCDLVSKVKIFQKGPLSRFGLPGFFGTVRLLEKIYISQKRSRFGS